MIRFKRVLALLVALVTVLAVWGSVSVSAADTVEITLIHDTHVHGNFASGNTNIAHKAAVINEIRSRIPDALFVGNGDDLATSVLSSVFKGSHVIDAFNQMGLVVDGVGNHDFDYGPENFAARAAEAKFPFVTANLVDKATGDAPQGARRFVVQEVKGVKIGFTSLAPADTAVITSLGDGIAVLDHVKAMEEVMPRMREAGAQVIVVLSHVCGEDAARVAAAVPGIDVFVGDHCAKTLEKPIMVGNTIISRVGDEYHNVGELTLEIKDGKVVGHKFTLHALAADGPKDPAIAGLMEKYEAELGAELGVPVGKVLTPFDTMKSTNRQRETAAGNWIADQVRAATGAEIAFINGGNIRADKIFAPGTVLTKKDIVDTLPFTNYLVQIGLSGQTIIDALNLASSTVETGHGRFLQVSGIQVKYDLTRPAGDRVVSVLYKGSPLDPKRIYRVAMPDFVAGGGDGYEMFKGAPVLVNANSAPLMSALAIDALAKAGEIAPRTEGRIIYVNGVSMTLDKAEFSFLGNKQVIDAAPFAADGKVYLPLQAIGELYGRHVEWDGGATATVNLPWWQTATIEVGADGTMVKDGKLYGTADILAKLGVGVKVDGETITLSFKT